MPGMGGMGHAGMIVSRLAQTCQRLRRRPPADPRRLMAVPTNHPHRLPGRVGPPGVAGRGDPPSQIQNRPFGQGGPRRGASRIPGLEGQTSASLLRVALQAWFPTQAQQGPPPFSPLATLVRHPPSTLAPSSVCGPDRIQVVVQLLAARSDAVRWHRYGDHIGAGGPDGLDVLPIPRRDVDAKLSASCVSTVRLTGCRAASPNRFRCASGLSSRTPIAPLGQGWPAPWRQSPSHCRNRREPSRLHRDDQPPLQGGTA